MMRACQKNTCPQGIATQDPELRARFKGKPSTWSTSSCSSLRRREILAQLGFRTLEEEAIGHVECLDRTRPSSAGSPAASTCPTCQAGRPGTRHDPAPDHRAEPRAGEGAGQQAHRNLPSRPSNSGTRAHRNADRNVNRGTVGTHGRLEITRRYGEEGLPDDTIDMTLHGSEASPSVRSSSRGETMRIYGEVNDYAGKGSCPAVA